LKGDVLVGTQLEALVDGLAANNLLAGTSHLLTGYIGSVSFLDAVAAVHARLLQAGANVSEAASPVVRPRPLTYVCDPVLGDNGKFYVPEALVEVYKAKLLPLATVLTPNGFEVEQLTGLKVSNLIFNNFNCHVTFALTALSYHGTICTTRCNP